ncbi:MAG: hypothetical protein K2X27_16230 [Candidatus Obscuribacterales bacterium]|nr:hypothetical protein [Candidatus Obscuribacterales bacterium]
MFSRKDRQEIFNIALETVQQKARKLYDRLNESWPDSAAGYRQARKALDRLQVALMDNRAAHRLLSSMPEESGNAAALKALDLEREVLLKNIALLDEQLKSLLQQLEQSNPRGRFMEVLNDSLAYPQGASRLPELAEAFLNEALQQNQELSAQYELVKMLRLKIRASNFALDGHRRNIETVTATYQKAGLSLSGEVAGPLTWLEGEFQKTQAQIDEMKALMQDALKKAEHEKMLLKPYFDLVEDCRSLSRLAAGIENQTPDYAYIPLPSPSTAS